MHDDVIAWQVEEQFWTGDVDRAILAIDRACVMAFAAPIGILAGPAIAASLTGAPRWSAVVMTRRTVARPAPDLLVLGYQARGAREGAAPYEAYCTSVYRHAGADGWKLVQHQQTPIPATA